MDLLNIDNKTFDEFIEFLIRAKKSTYAGKGSETYPSNPNSHDLHYSEENLKYIDTYLGGEKFAGEEGLWYFDQPIWSMNYIGRIIATGFSGDFLKEALLLVPKDLPFRGPLNYSKNEYKYTCEVEGDFNWFNGLENIYNNNTKVYECRFHGGIIK